MKKKLLALALSLSLVSSMALAGCGSDSGNGGNSGNGGAKGGNVQEITWMFWDDLDASEDMITKGYKEVVDRFNKDYAGKYHVTPVTTTLEEYYTKLNAQVEANKTPDVFIVSPGPNLTEYVTPGITADLTDYLKSDGWVDKFNGGMNAFSQQTYDGKVYAVPLNIAAACVFYNTEMFQDAGITTMPADWNGLIDACDKLHAKGYTPITVSAGTAWCLSMICGYLCDSEGVDLKAINEGTAHWTDANVTAAAEKMVTLSKYFQKTAKGDNNDVATANFYNGEAAMLIQGSWAIGQMNGANPEIEAKCGVFAFPGTNGRVIAKSDSLAMSSTTKYPEASIAFMKYFTDDTAQKYTAEQGGKIPVTTVKYDEAAAPKQLAYVMDVFKNAKSTFGFYNESLASSEAGSTFDNAMVDIYLGNKTVKEGLEAIEDYYKKNVWK